MIRVLIKASSPIARAGIESLVQAHPGFEVVTDSSDDALAGDAVAALEPDVMLAEIESQNDGATREVLDSAPPGTAVVLLARAPTAEWLADALQAGVKAVLPLEATGEEIVAALEAAAAGLVVVHASDLELLFPDRLPATVSPPSEESWQTQVEHLTPREVEVLRLLAEGLANKEIASRLNVSEHTAKFHVASVMGKLGAASRTEAVMLGIRNGLIMI